jgi:DNA-directed RNA polymerase alpha subunit
MNEEITFEQYIRAELVVKGYHRQLAKQVDEICNQTTFFEAVISYKGKIELKDIRDCGLTKIAENALIKARITNNILLCGMNWHELRRLKNMGKQALLSIKSYLDENNVILEDY